MDRIKDNTPSGPRVGRNGSNRHDGRLQVVSVSCCDGVTTIVLAGDLDLSTATAARSLLEVECERRPSKLVLDVSALDFVDSSGLSTFVRTHRSLAAHGASLALAGASPSLRRLLEIASLSALLEPQAESP